MSHCRPLPSFALLLLFALACSCGHDAPAPSTPRSAAMPATPATDPSASRAAVAPPSATPAAPQMAPDVAAISCSNASDCELMDDYCGSCRCLSLMHGTPPPACSGARVQCFVAPCRGKRAGCRNHTCTATDSGSGGM
jgi:hypothetical protein